MRNTFNAFYSELVDRAWGALGTVEFRDATTGVVHKANHVSEEFDGKPGFVDTSGRVVRPPFYESYVLVGEIGPGKLEPVK